MKFKERIFILIVLALMALPTAPLLTAVTSNFCLVVRVVEDGRPIPCLVYLMAFYPEGFKPIGYARAIGGVARFWIPINDLKSSWFIERSIRGRFALPSFAITVFTNSSKADFRVITLKWSEFKPYALGGYKEVTITPRHKMNKKIVIRDVQRQISPGLTLLPIARAQPYPPYKPGTYVELVDYLERAGSVVLLKVVPDSYSTANLQVNYVSGHTVSVSVRFFLFSIGEWDIGDYLGLSRSTDGGDGGMPSLGQTGYIIISATYRWEHWVYYDDLTGEKVDECYLVYWKDFDPTSIEYTTTGGVEASVTYEIWRPNVDGKGIPPGASAMETYASATLTGFSTTCTDSGWFIEVLSKLGKISSAAATAINLVIDVSMETKDYQGFIIAVSFYGEEGMKFNIEKGESTWIDSGGNYPAVYFKVYRV